MKTRSLLSQTANCPLIPIHGPHATDSTEALNRRSQERREVWRRVTTVALFLDDNETNDVGEGTQNDKKIKFYINKQQLCTWITLFCTFLCHRCTTTTLPCLSSRKQRCYGRTVTKIMPLAHIESGGVGRTIPALQQIPKKSENQRPIDYRENEQAEVVKGEEDSKIVGGIWSIPGRPVKT